MLYYILKVIALIFIGGIHGVGKSYFCCQVEAALGVKAYSSSALIADEKHCIFSNDKLIPDIDDNQTYLLTAVTRLNETHEAYLLDGHFCLRNAQGKVTRIPQSTFIMLKPKAIVLLTDLPEVITDRRYKRDGIVSNRDDIRIFQNEEVRYAKEIATILMIAIHIVYGEPDIYKAIDFIARMVKET